MLSRLTLLTFTLVACADLSERPLHDTRARTDVTLMPHRVQPSAADAALPEPDATPAVDAGASPRVDAGGMRGNGYPILQPYLVNARDLGGTPLKEQARVAYGKLFRGPPMALLFADGCSAFAELGIRSVIDLRDPTEVQTKPSDACVREKAGIIPAPLPIPYAVSPEDYVAILGAHTSMLRIFRLLADPAAYPVYFHCTWGRDRTGVVAALVLKALGASREDILEEYLLSNQTVGAYPLSLTAAMDEIESRGGIEAYLQKIGLTQDELHAVRTNTIAPAR
jgi:protein-tyrosine phosphatase